MAPVNGEGKERQTNVEVRSSDSPIVKWALSLAKPHCEVCQKKDHGEEMLLCDGCDCGAYYIAETLDICGAYGEL